MATQTTLYCCVGGSNEYVAHSGDYFNPDTINEAASISVTHSIYVIAVFLT